MISNHIINDHVPQPPPKPPPKTEVQQDGHYQCTSSPHSRFSSSHCQRRQPPPPVLPAVIDDHVASPSQISPLKRGSTVGSRPPPTHLPSHLISPSRRSSSNSQRCFNSCRRQRRRHRHWSSTGQTMTMAHVPLPKRGPTMIPYMLRLAPSASTAVSHPARLHAVAWAIGLIDLRGKIIFLRLDTNA